MYLTSLHLVMCKSSMTDSSVFEDAIRAETAALKSMVHYTIQQFREYYPIMVGWRFWRERLRRRSRDRPLHLHPPTASVTDSSSRVIARYRIARRCSAVSAP